MATTIDIVPITPAMIEPIWVKPATLYYPPGDVDGKPEVAGENTATSDYTPRTTAEKAGAPGGPNGAAQPIAGTGTTAQDPNYVFARTRKPGLELQPYPTGAPNDITTTDIITPVECNPTLSVPTIPSSPQ